jgi:DNA mismatch repair protein MutH
VRAPLNRAATPSLAPASESELLARARALAGRTVGELAAAQGLEAPASQRRAKGFVGQLVERALGATASTRAVADFESLGVELKTLPVRRDGRPAESTFVCTIPLARLPDLDWADSPLRKKLARVLFLPVESEPSVPLAGRRLGTPFLWSPSAEEEAILRDDWAELAGLIAGGHVESLTAHAGRALQVRPKAAHGRVRTRAPEADGGFVATVPRGFYLRASFTAALLRTHLAAAPGR